MTALSLRGLWSIYKKILAEDGFGKRQLLFAQAAFFAGARSTLEVLAYLLEHGEDEELHRIIERQGRRIGSRRRRGCGRGPGGTDWRRGRRGAEVRRPADQLSNGLGSSSRHAERVVRRSERREPSMLVHASYLS
jgi:hypothetical protein